MSKRMAVVSQANTVMLAMGCSPLVSQGMCKGQTFCTNHGAANDVGWGWSTDHGCEFVYGVVKATHEGDTKTLVKLLNWSLSS